MNSKETQTDFILVHTRDEKISVNARRLKCEEHWKKLGLELTADNDEENEEVCFIKIHLPEKLLKCGAEILKFPVALKEEANFENLEDCDRRNLVSKKRKLITEYSKNKEDLVEMEELLNDPINRILIISYFLEQQECTSGINDLLAEGVYLAAYPLHESLEYESKRNYLKNNWASIDNWKQLQPIDEVKNYFGSKIALYFAWVGFYIYMLIPLACFGIIELLYGLITLNHDTLSNDICRKDIMMCPLCSNNCDFWNLKNTCYYAKASYIIDNPLLIMYGVLTSIWASVYLELWQRYRFSLIYKWNLISFTEDDEPNRPGYIKNELKKYKNKLVRVAFSYSIVVFYLFLTLGVVFGVIVYRMAFRSVKLVSGNVSVNSLFTTITADIINLIAITILDRYFRKLAIILTNWENPRTMSEYEDSLTLKTALFKFVNYYSAVFYLAFFKGKFPGYPAKYNRIFGFRQEECDPGGCLMELTIALAVILIGERVIELFTEVCIPYIKNAFKSKENNPQIKQYSKDYDLDPLEPHMLLKEYLTMVVQYGFISLFIIAFPLAPLLALINNVIELRLDALKFLKLYRRPVPQRAKDIGIWYSILKTLSFLAIGSNAYILAFSTNFIPKLYYDVIFNRYHNASGYLEFSLAYFNTSDFQDPLGPEQLMQNISICRYLEFRNPPNHEFKYKRPLHYWRILAWRLAFIIIYHNCVTLIAKFVKWIIPEVPVDIAKQIRKDHREVNNRITKQFKKDNEEN